jgi:phage shock protein A
MGILRRIGGLVLARINNLLCWPQNPAVVIAQVLQELGQGLVKARRQTALAIAAARRLAWEVEWNRRQAGWWQARAQWAQATGREAIEHYAFQCWQECVELVQELAPYHEAAIEARERARSSLRTLEASSVWVRRLSSSLLAREQAVLAWARFHAHVQPRLLEATAVPRGLVQVEKVLRRMEEQLAARVEIQHAGLRAYRDSAATFTPPNPPPA